MPDRPGEIPTTSKPDTRHEPELIPVEERYGAVPVDLAGIDPEELAAGDEDAMLAAHGSDGDAMLGTEGSDLEALELGEIPPAEAELSIRDEEDVDLSYRDPEYVGEDVQNTLSEEELRHMGARVQSSRRK